MTEQRKGAQRSALRARASALAADAAPLTLRWRGEYIIMTLFMMGSLLIPRPVHRAFGLFFALVFDRILARTTGAAIRGNLGRVLVLPRDTPPRRARREIDRRARRALLNYGTYLFDHAWFTLGPRERLRTLVRDIEGRDRLEAALASGRGAIVATAHLGLWDLGGAVLADRGHKLSVVALEGGDRRTNRYRDRARARRSIEVLFTGDAERSGFSLIAALAALRAGRIVAMLADRPTGAALVRIPFLGREAPFPTGAAALARASGAAIFPAFVVLDEERLVYRAVIEPPIEVARTADRAADHYKATVALVRVFERWVRAYPEQWYNFYPFWDARVA